MIYLFGDTHGSIDVSKLNTTNFPEQDEMTKDDYVIILGDFGFIWKKNKEMDYWLNWFNGKNFTTLFVDGNHENFNLLYQYPIIEKLGGKVHKINNSVFHLMRGEVFTIDEKNFFVFGGAESIDKAFRKPHVTWWADEIPNKEEENNGMKNLEECDYKIDYVLSHTCPVSIQNLILTNKIGTRVEDYLEHVKNLLLINDAHFEWFFGHYHIYIR
jgi:hypothetical protein